MKNTKKTTDNFKGIIELSQRFPDENSCREYFAQMRWNGKTVCPHCQNSEKKIYVFEKRNLYKCSACKKQFTITVGTVFEGSKIPLRKWMFAIYLLTNTSKGVSSMYLAKHIGLTQKSAWFVLHRIRYAIKTKNFWTAPLSNIVEADETYIGGKVKNMSMKKRAELKNKFSRGEKTTVVGMIDRTTGIVIAEAVKDNYSSTIVPLLNSTISPDATLVTDAASIYYPMSQTHEHHIVNHAAGEYKRGEYHTNTIEGFWGILKRGIIGVYHSISEKHTNPYVAEYAYRYNMRKTTDKARIDFMLNNCNGRLSYKQLIAKK